MGAWSWYLARASKTDYYMEMPIGSQWPVREVLKTKFHVSVDLYGDYHVDPEPTQDRDTYRERGKIGATVGIPGERNDRLGAAPTPEP